MSLPLWYCYPVGLIHHTNGSDLSLPHLHPCFSWLLEKHGYQLEISLWSITLSFCFLLKYSVIRISFACQTDERHAVYREFCVTRVGLYPCSLLRGTQSTLRTQAEAVASHQTFNQIQFKEKSLDMLPVSRLVGIPFAWFTQDCPRERLNTGDVSLQEGLKALHCVTLDPCHLLSRNS